MSFPDEDNIVNYYPLEKIQLIHSKLIDHKVELLNNFREFYDNLEVIAPDVANFRKNYKNKGKVLGNNWRRKNRFKRKDLEKYLTNSYVKQLPDNNIDKIRRTVISNLNKLNEKKFTIIVKEFIDQLEELMYSDTYDVINREIMNKVHDDTYYVALYGKLIKELIINKKWQKKMFNVIENNNKQFYWTLNKLEGGNEEFFGPFSSVDEALDDAMENNNYKLSFCKFLQSNFKNRSSYQDEIFNTDDNYDLNIYAKNKYNNFLRLIFSCVEYGIFGIRLIHHALMQLISTKELDQFAYLYELLNKSRYKLNAANVKFYEEKLDVVLKTTVISPKTKFKLQEFFKLHFKNSNSFEALALASPGSSPPNSPVKPVVMKKNSESRNMDCILNEYPINNDYEIAKDLFSKIKNYSLFYEKYIIVLLEGKESEQVPLIELLGKLWEDFGEFAGEFGSFIDNNLVNIYGEYEVDYPNSKDLFMKLMNDWLVRELVNKDDFLKNLRSKKSEDEDEKYNIELFNDNILDNLTH